MLQSRIKCAALRQARVYWLQKSSPCPACRQVTIRQQHTIAAEASRLPRIAQSSLWETIFPKSLRERTKQAFRPAAKRPTNPATYFIWIYILIGSQAIKILTTQNEFNAYMRKADLKLDKLREVVEKLQKGQPVDVEKVLGTGDEAQEQEWEEALREIENEELAWQENKRRRQQEQERVEAAKQDASPVNQPTTRIEATPDLPTSLPRTPPSQPGFF